MFPASAPAPRRRARLATLCALLLAGCAGGPELREPAPVGDTAYTAAPIPSSTAESPELDVPAQRFTAGAAGLPAWWRSFGSDDLDRLVEEALQANPTLLQAMHRLQQARDDYAALAGGTRYPQVNGSLNVARETTDPAAFGIGQGAGNRTVPPFTLYQATVSVSYSLDLSGANRHALEALAAQVDYQQYELEASRLALAGNIVTSAIRRASLAAQIDLSERILANELLRLQIGEQRLRAGAIAQADLLAQRSQVEQTRAGIAPLRSQLAQADHLLAVYLGHTPAQGSGPAPALDQLALPSEVPVMLPSELARSRPDIRASEALLHQAGANAGVATANLYPQVNLTANLGPEGTRVSDLVNVWSIGAAVTQPLFHGGQLRARQRSAQDALDAAAATYRQTVLAGLQQVADALRALEQDAGELIAREKALRDAQAVARATEARFDAGGVSRLALLDAQRQELQTSLDQVRIRAQRLSDTAALFQALGARP